MKTEKILFIVGMCLLCISVVGVNLDLGIFINCCDSGECIGCDATIFATMLFIVGFALIVLATFLKLPSFNPK